MVARHCIRLPDAYLIAAADAVAERIKTALNGKEEETPRVANDDEPATNRVVDQSASSAMHTVASGFALGLGVPITRPFWRPSPFAFGQDQPETV